MTTTNQFFFFFYVGMRQRKKARTRAWERQRELVLKFCVKIATVCTARHGTQLYLNMTNNNYARYKNNVCVRAFYVAKKSSRLRIFPWVKTNEEKRIVQTKTLINWVYEIESYKNRIKWTENGMWVVGKYWHTHLHKH